MTFAEALEYEVTRAEAHREIALHNASWEDFVKDVGDRATYTGKEVLIWLGY